MGCDATYVDRLAPTARATPGMETQRARPEPEHTGMGFHDSSARAWPRTFAAAAGMRTYRVRKLCKPGEYATITHALAQWNADRAAHLAPRRALIEIADSATYHEALRITLETGEHLHLRAALQARPVLQAVDYHDGVPEKFVASGAAGSRLTLEGLTLAGGPLEVVDAPGEAGAGARFALVLRHCRLLTVPDADATGRTPWRRRGSLCVRASGLALRIEHSVLGPLTVSSTCAGSSSLHVRDSTIDGGHAAALAVSDEAHGAAMIRASFAQATVIGLVQVNEIELAEDSVFLGPLLVARRSEGCVRYCYLAPGSRTPARALCHPQPVPQAAALPEAVEAAWMA